MRRTPLIAGVAAVVIAGVAAWQVPRLLDDEGDVAAARAFAQAWPAGDLDRLPWTDTGAVGPAELVAEATAGLTSAPQDLPSEVVVRSVERDGDRATAQLDVRWDLGPRWEYATSLQLQRGNDRWQPVFQSDLVHPQLQQGQRLSSRSAQPPRASITDRDGRPIVQERPVVTVGLQPSRASDLAASVRQVASLTDVDAAPLLQRATAARPDAFVEVVTLRREAYDAQRDRIRPIPGVVLREGTRQLAPTAGFARALLGSVGPATAEIVEQSGGSVRPDQVVGLSGLQKRFEEQLGGTAGLTVEVVDAAGEPAQELQRVDPVPGTALQLTLDPAVQSAADAALATAPQDRQSALLVVQPSTGDVLAVANSGPNGPGLDRALTGRYPPGSTFKIASTLALMRQGLTPDEVVPCPATTSVDGKAFKNAEDEVLGDQPFRVDFAHSCNTAFVGSADRVSSQQLQAAARDLGYGSYEIGLDVFGGEVPTTPDAVEHAAQMIGQGKVLASPLGVALSAAAVADGRLRPPRLLMGRPAAEPGPPLVEAADLRELMRLVVAEGTATVLKDVPGEPVSGKTGTAEFGTDVPPRTHAWFTGFSGDLAFSVLVEDGGFGGAVAVPVAEELLRELRTS